MQHFKLDGWSLKWINHNNNKITKKNFYSMNNMKKILPIKFIVTSQENSLSFMFISRTVDLEITKTSFLDYNSMYIITFVTIKNIGNTKLSDLYCKFSYIIYYKIKTLTIIIYFRF